MYIQVEVWKLKKKKKKKRKKKRKKKKEKKKFSDLLFLNARLSWSMLSLQKVSCLKSTTNDNW